VFLLNRLPTKAVKGKTPIEAWYGQKPSLQNLKIFGCVCFSHVPQVKRDKLDKKAEPDIFIGYSSITKAYKIFKPQRRKILVSRDVQFVEDEKWSWDSNKEHQNSDLSFKQDENFDDLPTRGTGLLSDIYQRCSVAILEPAGNEEAENDPRWMVAIQEELRMIEKNQTWELVDRPEHRKVSGVKWVFRTKLNADGSINKHKARLVVKGYAQVFGVDYSETFALVARLDTIRLLLALTAQNG